VTLGVEELEVGEEGLPVLPVLPLLPVVLVEPLSVDEEWPLLEPALLPELDDADPEELSCREVLLAPGCSWATTIPRTAVAPVAARMVPRVRKRSRDRAFSLLSGLFG
jgi:hypothetical protein